MDDENDAKEPFITEDVAAVITIGVAAAVFIKHHGMVDYGSGKLTGSKMSPADAFVEADIFMAHVRERYAK